MGVISCKLAKTQGGRARIYIDSNDRKVAEVPAVWNIETSDPEDREMLIYLGAQSDDLDDPLPALGQVYEINGTSDANLYLFDVQLAQHDARSTKWTATGIYRPLQAGTASNQQFKDDPITRPPMYWLETEQFTELKTWGKNQTGIESPLGGFARTVGTPGPIVNAALQDYDEPLEGQRNRVVWCMQRNYRTLFEIAAIHNTYDDTVNSTWFLGFAAHKARFKSVTCSQPQNENGYQYYTGVVRIALSRTAFYTWTVNRGFSYNETYDDPDSGELKSRLVRAVDDQDQPVSEPMKLNLDGTRRDPTKDGTTIAYLTHDEADYTALL